MNLKDRGISEIDRSECRLFPASRDRAVLALRGMVVRQEFDLGGRQADEFFRGRVLNLLLVENRLDYDRCLHAQIRCGCADSAQSPCQDDRRSRTYWALD